MPQRPHSPFRRRARQVLGRPRYYRATTAPVPGRPGPSVLTIAYTGVRRPCICTGCICLTPSERAQQKRVFALARAWGRAAYG